MMSKRVRQYIGILFAIVAYYIVHEGAHLIVALALHAFKKINFMGIGIQIDIYRDRLTDTQLGIFCIAGVTATLITAYALVYNYAGSGSNIFVFTQWDVWWWRFKRDPLFNATGMDMDDFRLHITF